jgi:hypothetical protein
MIGETGINLIKCPKCGGEDTRRSRRDGWGDFLHRFLAHKAYRCRTCRARFFVQDGVVLTSKSEERRSKKSEHKHKGQHRLTMRTKTRLTEAILFFSMLVVFYLFLKYIIQERPAAEPNSAIPQQSPYTLT